MKETDLLTALSSVLAPYLGPNMAKAAVDSNLKRVKPAGGPLTPAEVESLLQRLGMGLVVFVGEEKAAVISKQMRQAALWDGDATTSRLPAPR